MTQEDMAQEIIYPFGFDPSIARILGYVDAKIEECQKQEPVSRELSAWEEMRRYLDKIH